jgi:hypothetical protein
LSARAAGGRGEERQRPAPTAALTPAVREITLVEDCFENSAIREVRLACVLDETAVFRLAALGELEYFPEFPRPFFRVRFPGGGYLKGVAGAESFRVFFPQAPDGAAVTAFRAALETALFLPPPNLDR